MGMSQSPTMRAYVGKHHEKATTASSATFTLVIAALEAVDGLLPTSGSLAYVFCPRSVLYHRKKGYDQCSETSKIYHIRRICVAGRAHTGCHLAEV